MKKILAVLLAVLMAVLVFAGCASAPPAESSNSQESAPQESKAADAPKEPAGESGLKMAFVFPAPHPFCDTVWKGVEKFEEETGIEVIQQIGSDWTQATQNEQAEALAAQGVNAITIYPADASGANSLYEELTEHGIKITNFGTSTIEPTPASFAVATDVKQAAYDATEYVIKQMGEKGNILNVLEVLTDPNTVLRKEGVEECVAKYPDVKIIQEVAGITTAEEAVTKIQDALSANAGQVDGIVNTGFTTTVGTAQVLSDYYQKEGKDHHIWAVGIDTDDVTMQAIEDGTLDATLSQNPVGMGYITCMLLKNMIEEGYKPADGQYFINAGSMIVTKDNLDTYQAEIDKMTEELAGKLTTEYLTK